MKVFLLFLTLLTVSNGYSAEICFPKNNLKIPVGLRSKSMGEEAFNKAIDDIENIYKPIVKKEFKSDLKVIRKWSDETVNAYAQQSGTTWSVSMFGGLARHEAVTEDGFRAVVCHEIGHHIGGAPRKGTSWASNEGQADYFATAKCLKVFFEKDLNKTLELYNKEDSDEEKSFAKKECNEVFKTEAEAAICYRASLAGQSLANLFKALRNLPDAPKFSKPDTKYVTKTNHDHPAPQCRMDTYFQGSLCDNDINLLPNKSDVTIGYCTLKEKFEIGLRPKCWYAPSEWEN